MGFKVISVPVDGKDVPASELDRLYGEGYIGRLLQGKEATGGYGATQEAMGGVFDEFSAGIGAAGDYLYGLTRDNPPSFGDLYNERLSLARQERDRYREEKPLTSLGMNVLGGALFGPGAGATGGGAGLGTKMMQGAKAGAIGGSLGGFAEGEGGVGERVVAGATGAGIGAAVGGAAPVFTGTVMGLMRGIRKGFGLTGPAAQKQAEKLFIEALQKDGITLQDLANVSAERPMTIADLGPNTRQLLGTAYRGSQEGRKIISDFLTGRSQKQLGRIMDRMAREMGEDPTGFWKTADRLARERQKASPIYQRLKQMTTEVDEDLGALLERGSMKQAMDQARRTIEDAGEEFYVPEGEVSFDQLNEAKKALDKMIRWEKTPQAGADKSSDRGLRKLKDDLVAMMDARFEGYDVARKTSADPAQIMDAMEDGRNFMRGDMEKVLREVNELNPAELEAYRLGAARELYSKMAKVRDINDRSRLFENEDMRTRLKALFPDRATYDNFMAQVTDEGAMNLTRNKIMTGSDTAERLADDKRAVNAMTDIAVDLAERGPTGAGAGALTRGMRRAGERVVEGINENVGAELARIGTNPNVTSQVMPQLQNTPAVIGGRLPPAMTVPGVGQVQSPGVGGVAGTLTGRAMTTSTEEPQPLTPAAAGVLRGFEVISEGSDAGAKDVDRRLAAVERRLGLGLKVNSAERSEAYNATLPGAAPKSRHIPKYGGDARDISTVGMSNEEKAALIRELSAAGFGGIGIYKGHIHGDLGPVRTWGETPGWARGIMQRHLAKAGR